MECTDTPASLTVKAILFAATAILFRRLQRLKEEDLDGDRDTNDDDDSFLSRRAIIAKAPPMPYLESFFKCLQDPCDPIDNPSGYIALCVAENKLVTDLMAERLMQPGTSTTAFSSSEVYGYSSFLGLSLAREALSYFLAKRFLHPEKPNILPQQAFAEINPQHVAIGAGCAALLNYLFYILGEPGDVCLIPAPYYAAFENDMKVLAGCIPVPVHMANPSNGPTSEELDRVFLQCRSKGKRVKFLLVTNPNNPLGVIYKPDCIRESISWCRKRGIHTIMDEIYALSTHQKHGLGFESVIKTMNNELGNDVHFVWALSKDFGASGFRVGVLYSQNVQLLQVLSNLQIFSGVSHPIQMVTAEILTDDEFVDSFLEESRVKLRHSYEICASKLQEMVIPYVPAEAGLFIYCDFSSLLPEKSFEGERIFCDLVMEHSRVILTPGHSQRDKLPGMFRICYAWVTPEVLIIAMERLSKLVAKVRKMDWSDLNETTMRGVL